MPSCRDRSGSLAAVRVTNDELPGAVGLAPENLDRFGAEINRVAGREGPLAGLWPAAFRTDASGTVVFRGLEEGTHRLLIDGRPVRQDLRVGKAVRSAAPPVQVRVTR